LELEKDPPLPKLLEGTTALALCFPGRIRASSWLLDCGFDGPNDLQIEFPTHVELLINLKTAKALGLQISPMLLTRAGKLESALQYAEQLGRVAPNDLATDNLISTLREQIKKSTVR
jgi:hypothetical protein